MTPISPMLVLSTLALGLAVGCASSVQQSPSSVNYEPAEEVQELTLIEQVRRSAETPGEPADIRSRVSVPPSIDTTVDSIDLELIAEAGIYLRSGASLDLRDARVCLYWVLETDDSYGNPELIGFVWNRDGARFIFEGAMPPP